MSRALALVVALAACASSVVSPPSQRVGIRRPRASDGITLSSASTTWIHETLCDGVPGFDRDGNIVACIRGSAR